MHQVQVYIVDSEIRKCLTQSTFHILGSMLRIPQLPRDEYVLAFDSAVLDAVADFLLVSVYGSAVDVAVSCPKRNLNSFFHLFGCSLPCPESDSWDFRRRVECETAVKCHFWDNLYNFVILIYLQHNHTVW